MNNIKVTVIVFRL